MSQNEKILQHLLGGSSISGLEALQFYGCFRLAARIYDLRQQGWDIEDDAIDMPNGARIATYYLSREQLKQSLADAE